MGLEKKKMNIVNHSLWKFYIICYVESIKKNLILLRKTSKKCLLSSQAKEASFSGLNKK